MHVSVCECVGVEGVVVVLHNFLCLLSIILIKQLSISWGQLVAQWLKHLL